MNKIFLISIIITMFIIVLTGFEEHKINVTNMGLKVDNRITTIEIGKEKNELNYQIILSNYEDSIHIRKIKPILNKDIYSNLLERNTFISMDNILEKNDSILIEGKIIIDNYDYKDNQPLNDYIEGFKLYTENNHIKEKYISNSIINFYKSSIFKL